MLGIDVSNHQGRIDWQKVAADGVAFAWVKATEGRTYTDVTFLRNLLAAREAGVPVGVYHYARPDNNSPEAEADHFLSAIGDVEPGDLLPVLDFETDAPRLSGAAMTQWAARWLELVTAGIGIRPVFYSYPYFITGQMAGAKALAGDKLWLADYGSNDGRRHRQRYSFPHMVQVAHQYTSNGRVGGIIGRVDLNWAESLEPIVYRPATRPRRPLPGPAKKPAWFWAALREFLARRRGSA